MKKSSLAIISSGALTIVGTIIALVNKLNDSQLTAALVLVLCVVLVICITYCVVTIHTNYTNRKIADKLSQVATNETDKQHEYNMKALDNGVPHNDSPTPIASKAKELFMSKSEAAAFRNDTLKTIYAPSKNKDEHSSDKDKSSGTVRIRY